LFELEKIPGMIDEVLDSSDQIQNVAKKLVEYKNFFFL
jgi:glucosamine 6-phosphate synthetase-like amidotransferase/phosphosugar isomerase protein